MNKKKKLQEKHFKKMATQKKKGIIAAAITAYCGDINSTPSSATTCRIIIE